MRKIVLAFALSAAGSAVPAAAQVINLSCVEALVAVGHPELAGVFSFVPEIDNATAFADLLARDAAAQKKFIAKVEKDLKKARGITVWDHDVLRAMVTLYGSPLGETLHKPAPKVITRMAELVASPTITLEEMTARRKG